MQTLNQKQAAELLEISPATLKNWVKKKYIIPIKADKLLFHSNDIRNFKKNIGSDAHPELKKRANKIHSKLSFIPEELLTQSGSRQKIIRIQSDCIKYSFPLELLMMELVRLWLIRQEIWENKSCLLINQEWLKWEEQLLENVTYSDLQKKIRNSTTGWELPEENDITGIMYQCLVSEGFKSRNGSYFTPDNEVTALFSYLDISGQSLLDPCCGSGRFLMKAASIKGNYRNLTGIEKDPIAAKICLFNLMSLFPEEKELPVIIVRDYFDLSESEIKYDIITGNPPWGALIPHQRQELLKTRFPSFRQKEISQYFVLESLNHLKENGLISFLLPESLLTTRRFSDFRQFLIKQKLIYRIVEEGQSFYRVQSRFIQLHLKIKSDTFQVFLQNKEFYTFSGEDSDHMIDPLTSYRTGKRVRSILKQMDQHGSTLLTDSRIKWFMGIVTGKNSEYLKNINSPGTRPVLLGRDINAERDPEIRNFLLWKPEQFQQKAPLSYYESEKILYRFISPYPVCIVEKKGLLCLNSANGIILPDTFPMNYPELTMILNSKCIRFYHINRFCSLKILKFDLMQLPLPGPELIKTTEWEKAVNDNKTDVLEELLMNYYHLSNEQKEIVNSYFFEKARH